MVKKADKNDERPDAAELGGEFTEEQKQYDQLIHRLGVRYPTFVLLGKVLQRYRRLLRLRNLKAPEVIIASETASLESALEDLANAFPYDTENHFYHFPDLLGTIVQELQEPHATKENTDA